MKQYTTGLLSGITITSLALAGLLAATGFQGPNMKMGVVDSGTAQAQMRAVQASKDTLNNALTTRENIMSFLQQYPLISVAEAEKFKALSLKAAPTDADKQEIQRLMTVAKDAKKKADDLSLKSQPSDADAKALADYRDKKDKIGELLQKIQAEFQNDLDRMKEESFSKLADLYKATVSEVGKKQGFTIVFDKGVAPYSANDITEEVVTTANKKP
jgi:Skp family chaperone for outer membrane proteins